MSGTAIHPQSQHEQTLFVHKYQGDKWDSHFNELRNYLIKHQRFPDSHPKSTKLAGWVKRQRCHYKRLKRGKKGLMTNERIEKLESIGFIWDKQEALWQQRFNELVTFKWGHGHCLVPHDYQKNPQLANWVKCQRRQYRQFKQKSPSNIKGERFQKLDELGFFQNTVTLKNSQNSVMSKLSKDRLIIPLNKIQDQPQTPFMTNSIKKIEYEEYSQHQMNKNKQKHIQVKDDYNFFEEEMEKLLNLAFLPESSLSTDVHSDFVQRLFKEALIELSD